MRIINLSNLLRFKTAPNYIRARALTWGLFLNSSKKIARSLKTKIFFPKKTELVVEPIFLVILTQINYELILINNNVSVGPFALDFSSRGPFARFCALLGASGALFFRRRASGL